MRVVVSAAQPAGARASAAGATISVDELLRGKQVLLWGLRYISRLQAQQDGHGALGKHAHGFDMCRRSTRHAPTHGVHSFHPVSYGDVVPPGSRAVGNGYDPAESLLAH